jgi:hypothetical protein
VPHGIKIDQFGNKFISGGTYKSFMYYSSLMKLNPIGDIEWINEWGGEGFNMAYSLSIDSDDNLYVGGVFSGSCNFSTIDNPNDLRDSDGYNDLYLCKFNPHGDMIWANTWGSEITDNFRKLTITDSNSIYVVGELHGNYLNCNWNEDVILCEDNSFILNMSTEGVLMEMQYFGGIPHCIALDNIGNIFVAGYLYEPADIDPTEMTVLINPSDENCNAYIFKINSDSQLIWYGTYGGGESIYTTSMIIDDSRNFYIAGQFEGIADFDLGAGIFELESEGELDAFLCKYTEFGELIWAHSWGGTENDFVKDIAIDHSGNVYATGGFRGVVNFCPGSTNLYQINIDSRTSTEIRLPDPPEYEEWRLYTRDAFVSKFNQSGEYLWVRTWGSIESDDSLALIVDSDDNILVTGNTVGEGIFIKTISESGLELSYITQQMIWSQMD